MNYLTLDQPRGLTVLANISLIATILEGDVALPPAVQVGEKMYMCC